MTLNYSDLVTAVVLSKRPYSRKWLGVRVLPIISTINSIAEFLDARFNAVQHVQTSWFFYLDDDDDLPADYLDVIDECVRKSAAVVYTDELITEASGEQHVRQRESYSREAHLKNVMLIHHLALYKTEAAKAAITKLPRGTYAPDLLLPYQVAKAGAVHVPRIGYIWHRRDNGMHNAPDTVIGLARALAWCYRN